MRSRSGCLTCRQRKLKCDEIKPICGHCRKSSRECVPCSGINFRHHHNASLNGGKTGGSSRFYAYKDTFDRGSTWLKIPRNLTFIHTTNPYEESEEEESRDSQLNLDLEAGCVASKPPQLAAVTHISYNIDTSGLNALSAVATGSFHQVATPSTFDAMHVDTPRTDVSGSSYRSVTSPRSCVAPSNDLSFILNPLRTVSPPVDPRLDSPRASSVSRQGRASSVRSQAIPTGTAESNHEIAFLLRWFVEGPGWWMDLFDLDRYFSTYIPVKAVSSPMLKYAAVAFSAKALARVRGVKPTFGGTASVSASTEIYPRIQSVDWQHKATEYYDLALALVRCTLQEDAALGGYRSPSDHGQARSPASSDITQRSPVVTSALSSLTFSHTNSDELLAAAIILCLYEFLDDSGAEWSRHLEGAKNILDVAKVTMMPLKEQGHKLSRSRRAMFWNLARQDMLSAFINRCHTRLDTEDLSMWIEAGIPLENGLLQPNRMGSDNFWQHGDSMREDMVSNALVWLESKLVNFMATGDELLPGSHWTSLPQRTILEYWMHLKDHFDLWRSGLPPTFQPVARVDPMDVPEGVADTQNDTTISEVWYSNPMCASTMQHYHMSQIQLLLNKPHESTQLRTSVLQRLNSYEQVIVESRMHAREIVGISLSRLDATARIHSVQPLYTAGQCLEDVRERKLVLKLLREIEADTGWASEYRVKALLQQWGWTEEEAFGLLSFAAA